AAAAAAQPQPGERPVAPAPGPGHPLPANPNTLHPSNSKGTAMSKATWRLPAAARCRIALLAVLLGLVAGLLGMHAMAGGTMPAGAPGSHAASMAAAPASAMVHDAGMVSGMPASADGMPDMSCPSTGHGEELPSHGGCSPAPAASPLALANPATLGAQSLRVFIPRGPGHAFPDRPA